MKLVPYIFILFVMLPFYSDGKIIVDNYCGENENPIEERKQHLQRLRKIEVSDGINVEIISSSENRAVIKSNYADYVMLERSSKVLKIYYFTYEKHATLCKPQTTVQIYTPNIKKVRASKRASVIFKSPVKRRHARISLFSGANLKGNFEVKKFRVTARDRSVAELQTKAGLIKMKAHGRSKLTMSGKARWLKVKSSKSCDIDLNGLLVRRAKIESITSSTVQVNAVRLIAKADNSGRIIYKTPSQEKIWEVKVKQKKGGLITQGGAK